MSPVIWVNIKRIFSTKLNVYPQYVENHRLGLCTVKELLKVNPKNECREKENAWKYTDRSRKQQGNFGAPMTTLKWRRIDVVVWPILLCLAAFLQFWRKRTFSNHVKLIYFSEFCFFSSSLIWPSFLLWNLVANILLSTLQFKNKPRFPLDLGHPWKWSSYMTFKSG